MTAKTIDPHVLKAAEIFNVPVDKVTEEQRRYVKQIAFSLAYGTQGRLIK